MKIIYLINTDEYYIRDQHDIVKMNRKSFFIKLDEIIEHYIKDEITFTPINVNWPGLIGQREKIIGEFNSKDNLKDQFAEYLI